MRGSLGLAIAIALAAAARPAGAAPGSPAADPVAADVIAALNVARTDPARYAQSLRTFRAFFHARLVSLPGAAALRETSEGAAAVDESIAFLARQVPLAPLRAAPLLAEGATDHVTEQAASGAIGHWGRDGSTPGQRVRRHGGGDYVAEVIVYGDDGAADAVRQLVVDDGVADRGHRAIIYSPELRYAGVSCGRHPAFRTMCVIDLAATPDGSAGEAPRPVTRLASAR